MLLSMSPQNFYKLAQVKKQSISYYMFWCLYQFDQQNAHTGVVQT